MKVVEFRMPLPLTLEQYHICQLYMVAQSSLEATSSPTDGVECLVSETYDDSINGKGQYTHKKISGAGKVPGWMLSMVNNNWLTLDEKSWNSFPKLRTVYESPFLPKLQFIVQSMHVNGNCTEDNATGLNDDLLAQRRVITIDINQACTQNDVNEQIPFPAVSVQPYIGTLGDHWAETHSPIITCYKVFILHIPLGWGISGRVENWVLAALQNILIMHHRRAINSMNEWLGMTLQDMRLMEERVKIQLDQMWKRKRSSETSHILDNKETIFTMINPNDHISTQASHLFNTDSSTIQYHSEQSVSDDQSELINSQYDDESFFLYHLHEIIDIHQFISPQHMSQDPVPSIHYMIDDSPPINEIQCIPPVASPSTVMSGLLDDAELSASSRHTGYLYKLGDGYLNTTWNLRYIVLNHNILTYYSSVSDTTPRDVIDLTNASVSWSFEEIKNRSHHLIVTIMGHTKRQSLLLCGETEEETKQWMLWLQMAAVGLDHNSSQLKPFQTTTPLIEPIIDLKHISDPESCLQMASDFKEHTSPRIESSSIAASHQQNTHVSEHCSMLDDTQNIYPHLTTTDKQNIHIILTEICSVVSCFNTTSEPVLSMVTPTGNTYHVIEYPTLMSNIQFFTQHRDKWILPCLTSLTQKQCRSWSLCQLIPLFYLFIIWDWIQMISVLCVHYIKEGYNTHMTYLLTHLTGLPFLVQCIKSFQQAHGIEQILLIMPIVLLCSCWCILQQLCLYRFPYNYIGYMLHYHSIVSPLRFITCIIVLIIFGLLLVISKLSQCNNVADYLQTSYSPTILIHHQNKVTNPSKHSQLLLKEQHALISPYIALGSLLIKDVDPIHIFRCLIDTTATQLWLPFTNHYIPETQQLIGNNTIHSTHLIEIINGLPSSYFLLESPLTDNQSYYTSASLDLFNGINQFIGIDPYISQCYWKGERFWGVLSNGSIFILTYSSSSIVNTINQSSSFSQTTNTVNTDYNTINQTTNLTIKKQSSSCSQEHPIMSAHLQQKIQHTQSAPLYYQQNTIKTTMSSTSHLQDQLNQQVLQQCESVINHLQHQQTSNKCNQHYNHNLQQNINKHQLSNTTPVEFVCWLITPIITQSQNDCRLTQLTGINISTTTHIPRQPISSLDQSYLSRLVAERRLMYRLHAMESLTKLIQFSSYTPSLH